MIAKRKIDYKQLTNVVIEPNENGDYKLTADTIWTNDAGESYDTKITIPNFKIEIAKWDDYCQNMTLIIKPIPIVNDKASYFYVDIED